MIVENDPNVRTLWEFTKTSDDAIFIMSSGISALRQLNQIDYDVEAVIIDLMLPDIDGMTVTENIRRNESIRNVEPCMIFWFTGYDVNETLERARQEYDVAAIYQKPMDLAELIVAVKGHLAERREKAS
jgi:CheY-like chemotaxis protein